MSLFIYLCLSKGNSSYGLEFVVVCVFGVYHALGAEVEFVALGALVPDFVDGLWNVSMLIILHPSIFRRWRTKQTGSLARGYLQSYSHHRCD